MKPFNPLFDKIAQPAKPDKVLVQADSTALAAFKGHMQLAYCGDIPVYFDANDRIVHPIRKE